MTDTLYRKFITYGDETMGENEKEISIIDTLQMLLPYTWLIAACAIVFALGFFVKYEFFTDDTYTSSGVLFVSNHMEGMVSNRYAVEGTDIQTSRIMTETCAELLKTRSFLTSVSEATGQKYNWRAIRGMTGISAVNETELLAISVTSGNPEDSYNIAKTIIETAPKRLDEIFLVGTIEIIDEAMYPSGPNGRGIMRKTIMGFAAGFVVGVLLAFMFSMFDKKVHRDTDLQGRYNIPMLGNIMNE